jgi:hypothetical protein
VVFEPNRSLKNQKVISIFFIYSFSALLKGHDLSFKPFDVISIDMYVVSNLSNKLIKITSLLEYLRVSFGTVWNVDASGAAACPRAQPPLDPPHLLRLIASVPLYTNKNYINIKPVKQPYFKIVCK